MRSRIGVPSPIDPRSTLRTIRASTALRALSAVRYRITLDAEFAEAAVAIRNRLVLRRDIKGIRRRNVRGSASNWIINSRAVAALVVDTLASTRMH